MYTIPQVALKYLQYYLFSSNGKGHGTHSPFVFQFITEILNDKEHYPAYTLVESLRTQLLDNNEVIRVEDFGAGSALATSNERKVASIAKNAAKSKKLAQLLFRMVKKYQPKTILELGTSLGITTSYLSLANPSASILTMEGSGVVADFARKNFSSLQLSNILLIEGNFDQTLTNILAGIDTIDFVFLDGNHRQEPTERYFRQLLPKMGNDAILILDDIHWSKGMEQAWEHIKKQDAVRCTIDLFFIGVVIFRQEFLEKQDFVIRF